MLKSLRGQGATEYLVLLAVVLIIALVSIALLGFFPGLATDARITQSTSYWKGEARPFAILEHSGTTTGSFTFVIQNVDAQGQITLLNMTAGNATPYTTSTTFSPGETRSITMSGGPAGEAGVVYELPVNFSYRTANGLSLKQFGSKNVIGKYS